MSYWTSNPRIGFTALGNAPYILYNYYEANTQSFKAGQLVYAAGSATTAAITACATDATAVLGIAMKDATNVSSGNIEIPVMVIRPDDELIIKCTATGTAKYSNLFYPITKYGIYVASNICYMDYDDTTNEVFNFVEPIYTGAGGATYWAKVHLLASVAQITTGL